MKTYRVGGCVRDRLLGLPVHDIDWVVTGATSEQMIADGYRLIGRDFPVFLHPRTHEEYALARSERKTGPGYRGFETLSDPNITIEEDLVRRDLTINAIAEDETGQLVDPYGGQADLAARCLRHVSPAFTEDPVRALRLARFAARFYHLGFRVAGETRDLIAQMAQSGEFNALVAERVWRETSRALGEPHPQVFFETLRECKALAALFPEIDALFGVPQTEKYHPEIDTGVHVMMALKVCAEMAFDNPTRFAVLMHDLGKASTPALQLPAHHGHEKRGSRLVKTFCERWRVPKNHTEIALLTTEYHSLVHRALALNTTSLLKFFTRVDCFRKPDRLEKILQACLADARGRKDRETCAYPQLDYLSQLAAKLRTTDFADTLKHDLHGKALGEAIRMARLNLIKQFKIDFANTDQPGARSG